MNNPVQAISDLDLLAMMVGRKTATHMFECAGGRFEKLLSDSEPERGPNSRARMKLKVARELMRRCLAEALHHRDALTSPAAVRDYLRVTLSGRDYEVFMTLFLDAQNRILVSEEMFRGTLTQTSVYPREVVKRSLFHNAAAVIFAHNHPSGVAEPSHSDELLTQSLRQALALVDVKVLDHFIVGGGAVMSFAERGLL